MDRLFASPWFGPLATACAALVVALVVHRAGRAVLWRLFRHRPFAGCVLREIERPTRVLLPALAIQFVWQGAADDLPGLTRVERLSGVALIAVLTWLAVAAVRGVSAGIVQRHPFDAVDNLHARGVLTQTRVLSRIASSVLVVAGISFLLMTFPSVRQLGASLLASAGVIGLVVGIAAKPVFGNLIAGLQIALAQPIRLDDVLIVKGEWGRVEEITGSYVVLKIWDERRLVIPLQWFIENPFENWTRSSAQLLGTVMLYVDFSVDIAPLREEAKRLCEASADWDGRVCIIQVTDTSPLGIELRVLVSAPSAPQAFDLRCAVREGLVDFLQRRQPGAFPRQRSEWSGSGSGAGVVGPEVVASRSGRAQTGPESSYRKSS